MTIAYAVQEKHVDYDLIIFNNLNTYFPVVFTTDDETVLGSGCCASRVVIHKVITTGR